MYLQQQVLAVTTGIIDLGISTLVSFLFNFFFFFFTPQQNSWMESSWKDGVEMDKWREKLCFLKKFYHCAYCNFCVSSFPVGSLDF